MLHRGLANGWSAWLAFWDAKVWALRRLREVANSLRAPDKSGAFIAWLRCVAAARRAAVTGEWSGLLAEKTQLEAALEQSTLELSRRTQQLEEKRDRDLEAQRVALVGSAEERAALHAAQAKEERIDLLSRQVARRMLHRDVRRGWTSWHSLWRAKVRERAALQAAQAKQERIELLSRQIARRILRGDVRRGWTSWHSLWRAKVGQRVETERSGHEQRNEELTSQVDAAAEEIRSLREALEAQKAAAAHEKRVALERLRTELCGSAAEQHAMDVEMAREERVELLQRQSGRRLRHRELSGAWNAWLESREARAYALWKLRTVANKLRAPQLSVGFDAFVVRWERAKARRAERSVTAARLQLEEENKRLTDELVVVRGHYEPQLATLRAEKLGLLERVALLSGGTAEAEAALEAQLAAEKQERVELFCRQMARRLLNQKLASGFTAWVELHAATLYAKEQLRAATNRLRVPQLQAAFAVWARDNAETRAASRATVQMQREAELQRELNRVVRECEARVALVSANNDAVVQRHVIELTGSAEERLAARAEAAKAERVELLRKQWARRMLHRDLANGWSAWLELWEAKVWATKKLRQCSHRFRRPELSVAFYYWTALLAEVAQAREAKALALASKSLESQLRAARYELTQTEMKRTSQDEEISHLRAWLAERGTQLDDARAGLEKYNAAGLAHEVEALQAKCAALQKQAELADAKREAAESDANDRNSISSELLEKLLTEQRRSYEKQLDEVRAQHAITAERNAQTEEKLRADLQRSHSNVADLSAHLQEVTSQPPSPGAKRAWEPTKSRPNSPTQKQRFDTGPDAPPIAQQLAMEMKTRRTRVMDFFRSWDEDGDGGISRVEFHKAIPELGFDVPKADIDVLFNEWDTDGSDSLGFEELKAILKLHAPTGAGVSSAKKVGQAVTAAKLMRKAQL